MTDYLDTTPPVEVMAWIRTKALAASSKKTTPEQREARLLVQYGERVIQARQRCEGITNAEAVEMARNHIGKVQKDFYLTVDAWNRNVMSALKQEAEVERKVSAANLSNLSDMRRFMDGVITRLDQMTTPLLAAPSANGHDADRNQE